MNTFAILLSLLLQPSLPDGPAPPPTPGTPAAKAAEEILTLETVMSDPAWIGAAPERPRWSPDGRSIHFDRRRGTTRERDVFNLDPTTGETIRLDDATADRIVEIGDWNPTRTSMITTRDGDLIRFDPTTGDFTQITRTTSRESNPRFLADGRIAFERDGRTILRDLDHGHETEPAIIRFEDPSEAPPAPIGLAADQRRLFDTLRDRAERTEAARIRSEAIRENREHDVIGPIRLDPGLRETRRHLSPDARWMLLETAPAGRSTRRNDDMPVFVTDDGYVDVRSIRPKVGTSARTPERLFLIDLTEALVREIDLDELPDRRIDRLAAIRAENTVWRDAIEAATPNPEPDASEPTPDTPAPPPSLRSRIERLAEPAATTSDSEPPEAVDPRPLAINMVIWSDDGTLAAIQARSLDNKDRWIMVLAPEIAIESGETTVVEHLHDPAWIGWRFNEMGWLRNSDTLWFLSEGLGWSDLMAWRPTDPPTPSDEAAEVPPADSDVTTEPKSPAGPTGRVEPLVAGRFEVRGVRRHPTDGTLWYRSNREDPSHWRLERVDPSTGWSETMVDDPGMVESFAISPDGERFLFLHSTIEAPAELHVRSTAAPASGTPPLTHSTTARFDAMERHPPILVDIPGRHGRPIRGRLHLPPDSANDDSTTTRPAVLFIHGAGYLQNAHGGWSRYFREGMFHDLLAREGFVVLDLDYRASAGYGRDWRTAIARNMGPPELDDLEDGIAWLEANHRVDPERIGVYGGSYGGFLTLMGLFTRPDRFACGAALRPVTDWSHYNDGYTANILNTPEADPMAYRRSSPIEHAAGLEKPLLICHGMVDDNVPFQDTVRLAQRLIELEKEDWEVAIYPVEPHGFRTPSSWLDEYRRIRDLFRAHLLAPTD